MAKFQKKNRDKIVLVSNIGSSSRKYLLFAVNSETEKKTIMTTVDFDREVNHPEVPLTQAFYYLVKILEKDFGLGLEDIDVILERVVAVGEYFLTNRVIDQKYLGRLKRANKFDTIHTSSLLNELQHIFVLRRHYRQKHKHCKFKLVGISDSEFHKTIPKEIYTYALSEDCGESELRRFGYHGISMSEVAHKLSPKYENILAIHLGGGGSVTAIKNGQSIYNSFGMTPLSGIINMTRSGTIDPIAVMDLLREKKKKYIFGSLRLLTKKVKEDLYKKSGMLALTGEFDMRNILQNLKSPDKNLRARNEFALQVYIERINEYVGSAYSHLGEVEALALTGPILGNETFRKIFLEKIKWLPVREENIQIIKTEEESEMLRLAMVEDFV